mmetsp:Transcript_29121/g.36105  ORF Transcript_29121/g.36105 Transcript_29121/m.36105 type:complete len:134 (-) Transcript_29121:642-1043(-)
MRRHFTCTSYKEREIYLCGGHQFNMGTHKAFPQDSVHRYDIERNEWADMPSLNLARWGQASLTMGDTLYTICGMGCSDLQIPLNSIETLDLKATGSEFFWRLVEIEQLLKRNFTVAIPIDKQHFVILGGVTSS